MANFCSQCGKELKEGEVCNCNNQQYAGQNFQQQKNTDSVQLSNAGNKLVPISQIAVGAILVILGFMCWGYDWGIISIVAAVGFLIPGVVAIIQK